MENNFIKLRFLGFGILSGIPFYIILSTLSFYLSEHHYNPLEIGMFAVITLPYSLKFIWSPLLDTLITKKRDIRFQIFKQFGFTLSILTGICHIGIGLIEPLHSFFWMASLGVLISFFASLQDLFIDSLRLEYFHKRQQTDYIVMQTVGFRIGLLLGSAGVIYTAAYLGWSYAFMCFGTLHILMSLVFISFKSKDTESHSEADNVNYQQASEQTISSFLRSSMNKNFLYIILFVLFFKMGDICVQSMTTPLLFEYGYTKIAFANITKTYGIPMMIIGSLLLPLLLKKISFWKLIYVVLFAQTLSTLCLLFFVSFENSKAIHLVIMGVISLISGLTSATFITITSELSRPPFKTTQFNIFSTASALGRVLISAFSGFIAFNFSWGYLFTLMTIISVLFIIILIFNNKKIISKFSKEKATANIGLLHEPISQ
ncbi:MAG: hypothetical protein C0432_00560 [Candidatus Puniceispirillum sp.]|nr:hypothetical protein [Candidatus Pelagibacter sp.]MBA4282774.1 hypothetical protein [Candidatus Puniceispirillum sp.]